jgi:hypothetical protein
VVIGSLSKVICDTSDAGLFDHFEIPLPLTAPSSSSVWLEAGHGPFTRLVWSRPEGDVEYYEQLELKLEPTSGVVDFVTGRQRRYLGYSIRDLARRSPELRNAVALLSRRKIHFVGDLLSRERGYLLYVVGLEYADIEAFDVLLAHVGLRTSMAMSYWTPPFSQSA